MGRRVPKWTQKKLDERIAQGYGQGRGKAYKPWLHLGDISSKGVTTRMWSPKTERMHTFFSNVEKCAFLVAEFRPDFEDYLEQVPMEREITLDVARKLRMSHPRYWGTKIVAVLTNDGLLFTSGKPPQLIDCKHSMTEETRRVKEHYALRHEYALRKGFSIRHVTDASYPWQLIHNLQWIRMSVLQRNYMRTPEYEIEVCCTRLFNELENAIEGSSRQPLREFLSEHDTRRGYAPGLSVFAMRRLMWFHHLSFDTTVYFHLILRGPVSALSTHAPEPFELPEVEYEQA
ncbi:TnsA endonuclease C-terminal domain-containing protein [Variovorax sp. J22R115]|uniref:TnsA endonuclease C-terminal domain-containing protein n=1 Tax=Variovorax sp. J22R115 TaxID=3053509 RepID=UPI002575D7F0|nr:TnsA endonuclease C-terminal domain-containing protein [Variovorax sp. J22R115]MDM0048870.1 TnsA endonuclease N-terminal domain-containing protein [Variovorax sp. J22R115]